MIFVRIGETAGECAVEFVFMKGKKGIFLTIQLSGEVLETEIIESESV